MQQSLHKLGYADVARHLEEASVRDKPAPHASQHTFAHKNVMQIKLIQFTRPDAPNDWFPVKPIHLVSLHAWINASATIKEGSYLYADI